MKYSEIYRGDMSRALSVIPNLEKLAGASVLVTGAYGLIGSALTDMLMEYNLCFPSEMIVYAAGRSEEKLKKRFCVYDKHHRFQYVAYDALKPFEFKKQVDYIIHAAGNAHPAKFVSEPSETLIAAINGCKNLLDYAKSARVKRLLYISSGEVYGIHTNNTSFKEEDYGYLDILSARACYPMGKRAAETLCACYAAEFGLDVSITRPCHIYGPTMTEADSRAYAQFARHAARGEDIIMKSPGTQIRSYCYVHDCAAAILTALLNGNSNEAYNIADKKTVISIRTLAEAFAEAGGCGMRFEDPAYAERIGYSPMERSVLDSGKIEELGWKAIFPLKEAAKKTIEQM